MVRAHNKSGAFQSSGTSPFLIVGTPRIDEAFGNKLPVPEPATAQLLALALGVIWHRRRAARPALR
jgi:hypothetical protein